MKLKTLIIASALTLTLSASHGFAHPPNPCVTSCSHKPDTARSPVLWNQIFSAIVILFY